MGTKSWSAQEADLIRHAIEGRGRRSAADDRRYRRLGRRQELADQRIARHKALTSDTVACTREFCRSTRT